MNLLQVPPPLRYEFLKTSMDHDATNALNEISKAVRAYARRQQDEGQPIAHPFAKEAIAAIASAEVWSFL